MPIDGDPRIAATRIADEIDHGSASRRIEPRLAGEVRFPKVFVHRTRGGGSASLFGEFHGEFREVSGRWVLTGRFEIPVATRVLAVLFLMFTGTLGIVAAGPILSIGTPTSIAAGVGIASGFGAFLFLLYRIGRAGYRAECALLGNDLRRISNGLAPRDR